MRAEQQKAGKKVADEDWPPFWEKYRKAHLD